MHAAHTCSNKAFSSAHHPLPPPFLRLFSSHCRWLSHDSLQEGRERGKGPQTMTFKRLVRGNRPFLLLDESLFCPWQKILSHCGRLRNSHRMQWDDIILYSHCRDLKGAHAIRKQKFRQLAVRLPTGKGVIQGGMSGEWPNIYTLSRS